MSKASSQKDMSVICELIIQNKYGIHARPAAMLVKLASEFQSEITVEKGAVKVSGKSIMGLMTLEAAFGSTITITAEGVDAEKAMQKIQKLFDQKFNED